MIAIGSEEARGERPPPSEEVGLVGEGDPEAMKEVLIGIFLLNDHAQQTGLGRSLQC